MPNNRPIADTGAGSLSLWDALFEDCVSQALEAAIGLGLEQRAADLPAIARLARCLVEGACQVQAHEVHLDTDVSVGLTQVFFRIDGALHSFAWLPTRLRDPLIDHLLSLAGFGPNAWPTAADDALALGEAQHWRLTVVPTDEGMRDAILRRAPT